MSEIRNRVDQQLENIFQDYMKGESWDKCKGKILSIPELAIVDRDAELPESHMHPPEGVLIRFVSDLRKVGWIKEVK